MIEHGPKAGSKWFKFAVWFVDNLNFCEGFYYGTDIPKPENKLYNWFYTYWLWPWKQNDCICCNTVRGLMYGAVIGFILGRFL